MEVKKEAADLLDRLASAACVYEEFVLAVRMQASGLVSVGELTDAFTCKRCHRTQVFTVKHWRHPSQPAICTTLEKK